MRTKLIGLLVCAIALLGGANVVQRIMKKLDPVADEKRHQYAAAPTPIANTESGDVVMEAQFEVDAGGTLEIAVGHADVQVRSHAAKEARISVTLEGRDMERARAFFDSRNFVIDQIDDRVVVRTEPQRRSWNWRNNGHARITVVALVPEEFNGNLATSHGDLAVSDLQGKLRAATSHGDIEVSNVAGPRVDIATSHGDIATGFLKADRVAVRTSHGDIDVGHAYAERVEVSVSHGDVQMRAGGGEVKVTNSHGDIALSLDGPVPLSVSNSHGDIDIDASGNLSAELQLRADRVHVPSSYAFEGTMKKDHVMGRVNGGGPLVKARTSHGTITISS